MWCLGARSSLLSTLMLSRSRSALEPSSVMVAPFTDTRPAWINSSAFLRLAMPACERIFCNRSSGIGCRRFWPRGLSLGLSRRLGLRFFHQFQASQFLELLECRQLFQILQPELDQEFLGGLVGEWPAHHRSEERRVGKE